MRRVVKIGGSLLSRDDFLHALPQWLSRQTSAQTLVVVGGGAMIDAIRQWDEPLQLDPVTTHWRCVELLQTTLEIVGECFPAWHRLDTRDQLRRSLHVGFDEDQPTLIAAHTFYHPDCCARLPLDWRTTSDSIAAYLAIESAAAELVLLKSCSVDEAATVDELAAAGIVDQALPMIAPEMPKIRIETL